MLQALCDNGVGPDVLLGSSVGALNAGYVAGRGMTDDALAELAAIWAGLRRRDVFPLQPARLGAAAIGRAPSLCAPEPLRRLISGHIRFGDLEDAIVPIHVIATDVRSGEEVLISEGDSVDAILASAAIPAIFPSVRFADRDLMDGGVADNAAVSQAIALGADVIYVLPSGYSCALDHAPSTALASALQALTLMIEQRLVLEVMHFAPRADIRVLPPLCPLSVASSDFRHGAELIGRSRAATRRWIDKGGPTLRHPEQFLSLHHHNAGHTSSDGGRAA
jgi:NTE family protein